MNRLSALLAFYRRHSFLGYWIWAVLAVVIGMIAGETLSEDLVWMGLRYRVYSIFQSLGPRPAITKWTALVVVEDDEYWKGELARRVPIKRDYLAKLLQALSQCHPIAVGIDFDLRSPAADVSENPLYAEETEILKKEIVRVSADFPIVLPVSLKEDKSALEPSILDGIPSRPHAVVRGFIAMPYDFRQVPTTERLAGETVPSFALALVREAHERIGKDYERDPGDFPFGRFAPEASFRPYEISTGDLLHGGRAICRSVDHKLVILGAAWHRSAYGRGGLIDTHDTPLGTVGKYLMHANYVESLLEERTYIPLNRTASRAVEILFALVALHVLASSWPFAGKFATVVGMTALLAFGTYIGAQNLGVFGDFVFPAFFLVLHAIVDYVWDLIVISRKYHELKGGPETP